jgi:hypothetical protein
VASLGAGAAGYRCTVTPRTLTRRCRVPMADGFDTSIGAAFIATLAELQIALPGWRVPLRESVARMGLNPFTKEPLLFPNTRDPGPDEAPSVPLTLPFQCMALPAVEDWEDRYLALDFTLSNEPGITPADREAGRELEVMLARGLCDEPLFGGMNQEGDPRFLYSVPERIVERLATLPAEDLPNMLRAWNRRSRSANALEDLHGLRDLAVAALSQRRLMFIWQVHAYFRAEPRKH